MEYFPSPRPRVSLTSTAQGIGKFSGSNLLQLPIADGSNSDGSSRRSSNSFTQLQTQEDLHLNDTLR